RPTPPPPPPRRGAPPQLPHRLPARPDPHRRARALVRIDPDHHCRHAHPPRTQDVTAAGTPHYSGPTGVRASFEPRHDQEPMSRHAVNKPGRTQPAGGSRASPPAPPTPPPPTPPPPPSPHQPGGPAPT